MSKFRAQPFTRAERFDPSPMKFNQALSKSQPKPQAAVFSIKRRVSLSEGIEDPRQQLRFNSLARITNCKDGTSTWSVMSQFNGYCATCMGKFYRHCAISC